MSKAETYTCPKCGRTITLYIKPSAALNKMPVQPVDRTPRPNNNIKNKLPLPMWTPTATDV